jgi:hypothetical protein
MEPATVDVQSPYVHSGSLHATAFWSESRHKEPLVTCAAPVAPQSPYVQLGSVQEIVFSFWSRQIADDAMLITFRLKD